MARAGLIWQENDAVGFVAIPESGPASIGRASGSLVQLGDLRVSRHHARILSEAGAFRIEHLSRTNPTRVNGAVVAESAPLVDRARIEVGSIHLFFHDLAAADKTRLVVQCGYCQRANEAAGKECWYCGTSLVYASTAMAERQPALCRLLTPGGESHDLAVGDALLLDSDQPIEVRPLDEVSPDRTVIRGNADGPVLQVAGDSGEIRLNDQPVSGQPVLSTGDRLARGSQAFWLLVRTT